MSNFSVDQLREVKVYDRKGDELGKVDKIFLDSDTEKPNFISVKTGRGKERLIPTSVAAFDDDALRVPFDKGTLDRAPGVKVGEELKSSDQDKIVQYYDSIDIPAQEETDEDFEETGSMVRRAERLAVGTEWEQAGKARLRKRVVTRTETVEVPLQREELVIERQPLSDEEAKEGGDLGEDEEVIVLREERAVVEKEVVGVEKVTVGKRTVSNTEKVSASVQEERIDIDEQAGDDGR